MKAKEYNGHRSWNAWNVSLWINNDEPLYNYALDCLSRAKNNAGRAARYFMQDFAGQSTPDGAKYNHLCVKEAMQGLIEE